jgi:hypothetical protein
VTKAFNNAASPPVATKAELLARLRARGTPSQQMHLTPTGTFGNQMKEQLSRENETRIKNLMQSLKGSAQKLDRAAISTGLRGKASTPLEPEI